MDSNCNTYVVSIVPLISLLTNRFLQPHDRLRFLANSSSPFFFFLQNIIFLFSEMFLILLLRVFTCFFLSLVFSLLKTSNRQVFIKQIEFPTRKSNNEKTNDSTFDSRHKSQPEHETNTASLFYWLL